MRVTIKYVNHPSKPDAKYGNVKTADDQTIMVPVQRLGDFQRGMTCDIATENRTWGAGPDARPVIVSVGSPTVVTQATLGEAASVQQGYQGPPEGIANNATNTYRIAPSSPAPLLGPARGNPEARGIFATGIVGRAMGSGKFTISEIDVLLEEALRSYDKRFP